jgi:hypothetical protein
MMTNGCCAGEDFDAKETKCQCLKVNRKRMEQTCKFHLVKGPDGDVWVDKFKFLPDCSCPVARPKAAVGAKILPGTAA